MGLMDQWKRKQITDHLDEQTSKDQNDSNDNVEQPEKETDNSAYTSLKNQVHDQLINQLDFDKIDDLPPKEQDEEIRGDVSNQVDRIVSEEGYMISRRERDRLIEEIIDKITGLGPIQSLIDQDSFSEIMVNGPDEVYVEPRDGEMYETDVSFQDDDHVIEVINKIVRQVGRRVDESKPYTDARLQDGSRVNIIIPPLIEKPTITIRDFRDKPFTVEQLIDNESFTQRMADFLEACVVSQMNILISGGTGSGKTTTLNLLSNFIPDSERIITIEDTKELQLKKSHVLSCESRPPNIEGEGEVTIRDLVENSLRMRPDRIIIGECRGPEAFDLLQAMNTGHPGSMSTIHANSPNDALSRLENLLMMAEMELPQEVIRSQIVSSLDVVIQQDKLQDGDRKITKISEVSSLEGNQIQLNEIFKFEQSDFEDGQVIGKHRATGVKPNFHDKFERLGLNLESTIYVQNY